MDYKKIIIDMIKNIEDKEMLVKIYYFVKVTLTKDKKIDDVI